MKNGAPLVGLYDCGQGFTGVTGAPLAGFAELYLRNVMASGLVPQIAALMGRCIGSAAYSVALADFTVMVKGAGQLLLSDPAGDAGGDRIGYEELGGARTHSERSGSAHLAASDEVECLEMIRGLLSYLPQNNLEDPPRSDLFDPVDRGDDELDSLAVCDAAQPCDIRTSSRTWPTKASSSRSRAGGPRTS